MTIFVVGKQLVFGRLVINSVYFFLFFFRLLSLTWLLQLCDFLENDFLIEQVQAIKELSDHITNLRRVGPGLGEYMYDRESMVDDD